MSSIDAVTLSLSVKPTSERDISEKVGKTGHFGVLENVGFVKMIFEEFWDILEKNHEMKK